MQRIPAAPFLCRFRISVPTVKKYTPMKSLLLTASALAALLAFAPAHAAEDRKTPTTPQEKMGYAVGVEFAAKFRKEHFEFDTEMAIQGIRDAYAGSSQLSDAELAQLAQEFQVQLRRKIGLNRQTASMVNRERNDKFFATNKVAEGVKTLPAGVQYKVITAGTGKIPPDGATVTLNYRGTLLDGREFDKSEPGKPATLNVGGLIAGWRAVLTAMPVGSHWQVWIPAAQAYGERGAGTMIGPQEPLVYDVELLSVK